MGFLPSAAAFRAHSLTRVGTCAERAKLVAGAAEYALLPRSVSMNALQAIQASLPRRGIRGMPMRPSVPPRDEHLSSVLAQTVMALLARWLWGRHDNAVRLCLGLVEGEGFALLARVGQLGA